MDLHMPDMDGYTVTSLMRHDPRFCSLPVIAVTADVWNDVQDRCLACGMDAFVSKPIKPGGLYIEIVRQVCKQQMQR